MSKTKLYTFPDIFKFWSPLAATWLLMSIEGPFIAAIIARLENPVYNLAAYGVAFSFALIIESPIIMLLSASTAIVSDLKSYRKLRNFTTSLNAIITVTMLIFLLPSVYHYIVSDLIKLQEPVFSYTYKAVLILLPWPAAIGFRRFYQGILIRYNETRKVAIGTFIRLISMSSTALTLYLLKAEGHIVGASALSVGVTMECLFIYLTSRPILKMLRKENEKASTHTYKSISQFYYPLALTAMMTLGVHPIVTFFIGQSRMSLESLAVLPVLNSLVFIFRSVGLSFQEAAISLFDKSKEHYTIVIRFASVLALSTVSGLALVAFTHFGDFWFLTVSGLETPLANLARVPVMTMILFPALTTLISIQRALLIRFNHTSPITYATILEVSGIILTLYLSVRVFDFTGVQAAVTAYLCGRILANIFLIIPYNKLRNSIY